LNITYPVIDLAMKIINDEGMYTGIDGRLGKKPTNKTSNIDINQIKKHIDSFPKMESHYCRRDTKKLYLSAELNLSVMYKLYCDNVSKPVSQSVYSKMFHNYEPRLAFYKPKKDQCTKCNNYNNYSSLNQITEQIKTDWENHKRRERESLEMKKRR